MPDPVETRRNSQRAVWLVIGAGVLGLIGELIGVFQGDAPSVFIGFGLTLLALALVYVGCEVFENRD